MLLALLLCVSLAASPVSAQDPIPEPAEPVAHATYPDPTDLGESSDEAGESGVEDRGWLSPERMQPILDPYGWWLTDGAVYPVGTKRPKLWEGSLELGINGTEGNAQTSNVRIGGDLKRETPRNVFTLDLDYHKNEAESLQTAHRGLVDWRYERLFKNSPWFWYWHGTVDYDEFQAFDLRLTLDTGLGYQFIETDWTDFKGRFGAGVSREIGGPEEDWNPELVFGIDFERRITARQKVTASIEYYPTVTDFTDYRLVSKIGWEVLLDEAHNLSMKLSLIDRYDSTPHGLDPNDLDYAVTVLWGF